MSSIRFVHADQRRRFRAAALGAWVLGVGVAYVVAHSTETVPER